MDFLKCAKKENYIGYLGEIMRILFKLFIV